MQKTFDPHALEERWYAYWTEKRIFHSEPDDAGEPYSIVIPPPNVTGILHMGHALNNTIQDVLIRRARMQGRNACWIPGTDHASIATEGKVVAMLREKGVEKDEIGREAFLEHAWEWKEKYGGLITNQLRKLGCACDWERERFTMDEAYSRAVLDAFVKLYEKGLIYRGARLVNWCPASRSAISDEEVIHREVQGKLWYFRYPVSGSDEFVHVATTRPETMLGDTAVAMHPGDERYRHLEGKKIRLPLVDREIPVIFDDHVDPAFGTGCVKVTPAHDPNDYAMGTKHGLAIINIMNDDASLNENVPEAYRGMSREVARKAVVKALDAEGLIEKIEDYTNSVGYSQRGNVPIEFYLSEQWFMAMTDLAKPALEAVQTGAVRIFPDHWVKTYSHWLEDIQDWCISRQLWWGQRIPVWYRKGLDRSDTENRHVSVDGPPDPDNWEQDEDVLDTWVSSWLWPMAVHSWPEDSATLKAYYPTAVLVTGFDIIFFWVARMVMAGCEFMGEVPFGDVYIHGLIRDDEGQKMSKSLGNLIDPLEVIEEYSADALRFSLMMLTSPGQDVVLAREKFELGRNFGTKIWNAARFLQNQTGAMVPDVRKPSLDAGRLSPDDQHILAGLDATIRECNAGLDRYRLNDASRILYEFTWNQYCDWYVEYSKLALYGDDETLREQILAIMHFSLATILRMLHPFMPFLTEELWHTMGYGTEEESISLEAWPEPFLEELVGESAGREDLVNYVDKKHDAIRAVRMLMTDYSITPSADVRVIIKPDPDDGRAAADVASLSALLRVGTVDVDAVFVPRGVTPSSTCGLGTVYLPVDGLIDVESEKARLSRQLEKIEAGLRQIDGKLSNDKFIKNAPPEVVQQQRDRREIQVDEQGKLQALIDALNA